MNAKSLLAEERLRPVKPHWYTGGPSMNRLCRRALLASLMITGVRSLDCLSQAQQPYLTVRSQLLKSVRSGAVKQGDRFLIRTTGVWQAGNCTVADGSPITGTVAELVSVPVGSRNTRLGLQFDPISCAGDDARQLTPLLIALQAANKGDPDGQIRLETAQSEDKAVLALSVPVDPNQANQNPLANTSAHAASIGYDIDRSERKAPALKSGQVEGLGKITMQLPETTPVTHLLSSREIVLALGTTFVLRFVELPTVSAPAAKEQLIARQVQPKPKLPEPADTVETTDVCGASGCQEMVSAASGASGQPNWTLSLKELGYRPRLRQTVNTFGEQVTVQYLGPDQILLTFPLHGLVHRGKTGFAPMQRFRAVLLSASDGHVLSLREWSVAEGEGPYLWPLGAGRVLVHLGEELVSYGPGLVPEQHFPLLSPFAFASTSPEGDLVLVSVVHERYSAHDRELMASYLGPNVPIPEDYDLIGLDGSLKVLSKQTSQIEPRKPALVSSGIVAAQQRRPGVWDIESVSLAGNRKHLGAVQSGCGVEVNSLPKGLVLLRFCEAPKNVPVYRVLTLGGKTLLKGEASYGDLFQQAATDTGAARIAIATSHFDSLPDLRYGVEAGRFNALSVRIYQIASGKLLFTASPPAGSAMRNVMALSPKGDGLVIATSEAIQAYTLP